MIDLLKVLVSDFSHFQEHAIGESNKNVVGYQSSLITSQNRPFAGGTAAILNHARRICAAEAIERVSFLKALKTPTENKRLLLNEYPTTCGFAAGFEENSTVFRAVCEAVERWAWTKWIDESKGIKRVYPKIEKPLSSYFLDQFDEVFFFQSELAILADGLPLFIPKNLTWTVAIGKKGNGIFPGSRVTTNKDELWEHPLLEAWRHLLILENDLSSGEPRDLFDARIRYFGENGIDTLRYILDMQITRLPEARLRILEKVASGKVDAGNSYFVYRALCDNYRGWDCGDERRFIY